MSCKRFGFKNCRSVISFDAHVHISRQSAVSQADIFTCTYIDSQSPSSVHVRTRRLKINTYTRYSKISAHGISTKSKGNWKAINKVIRTSNKKQNQSQSRRDVRTTTKMPLTVTLTAARNFGTSNLVICTCSISRHARCGQ